MVDGQKNVVVVDVVRMVDTLGADGILSSIGSCCRNASIHALLLHGFDCTLEQHGGSSSQHRFYDGQTVSMFLQVEAMQDLLSLFSPEDKLTNSLVSLQGAALHLVAWRVRFCWTTAQCKLLGVLREDLLFSGVNGQCDQRLGLGVTGGFGKMMRFCDLHGGGFVVG